MEDRRGPWPQLALPRRSCPGLMRVTISKKTVFEEKQRTLNSLLSDPNLSQQQHIIKTLALS